MDVNYITRTEHDEFSKRLDSENRRQNARIDKLEEATKSISELTVSISKMAISMEGMLTEQKKMGERLDSLEEIPGKKWNTASNKMLETIVTVITTALITGLVLMAAQYIK